MLLSIVAYKVVYKYKCGCCNAIYYGRTEKN